jgi:general secretion pathway protein M
MNYFGDRLSRRQQRALYWGGGAVLVLLLLQFLFFPFIDAKKSVNQAIGNSEKTLGEIKLLAAEYRVLKQHADKIREVLARWPQDFTLFSHLEKIAGLAGVKSNIKYITAVKGGISGPYEELPVEIRLEKITLKQLTDFLYLLESPQDMIRIKNIAISKVKENPEYLAAQIQVVTFQFTKASGR